MRRPLFIALLVALYALVTVVLTLRVLLPAPAPRSIAPLPALLPPLTHHLLLVVVDGLRYDVATDPRRMPNFSAAMARETSGEMWASRVTMTSSAVMSYGTGQRGGFEQIVRNVKAHMPPYDSWLSSAHRAGLKIALSGDPTWVQMYGPYIDERRLDPEGVAIDVDFNAQTFAGARELVGKNPNFLIAHFVTPDHQGHTHTIVSRRYAEHIHGYDAELFRLLGELGTEWTVIVTSDHGAVDSGTHGSDVDIARRVPIFAYGPGIKRGVHSGHRLDQVDLAGTMAALLGVSAPAHSRGHLLIEWLDIPAERAAELACADAERAASYAELAIAPDVSTSARRIAEPCRQGAPIAERLDGARAALASVDSAVEAQSGMERFASLMALALVVVLAIAIAVLNVGASTWRKMAPMLGLGAIAIALTYEVERLPGHWPLIVRVALFVLGNAVPLLLLLRPAALAALFERRALLALLLIPGLLVAGYTANALPEAYVAVMVGVVLFGFLGHIDARSPAVWAAVSKGAARRLAVAAFGALLLAAAVSTTTIVYAKWQAYPEGMFVFASSVVAAWVAWRAAREPSRNRRLMRAIGFSLLAIASLALRRFAPPPLGRTAILFFGALAFGAALSRRRPWAAELGIAGYTWVSRDFEMVTLIASLFVAEGVGRQIRRPQGVAPTRLDVLLLAAFGFGLLFVERVGITGQLDFGGMDFAAAGFHDLNVSMAIVTVALVYKYLLAALLALGLLASRIDATLRERFLKALIVMEVARTALLFAMLLVCGKSYWSGLRVLGDLPFPLIAAASACLVWAAASRARSRANEPQHHRNLAPILD